MTHDNIEIKARSTRLYQIRDILKERSADFKGLDHQIDTYFNSPSGRLKLREGNIEHALIHYEREAKEGPKLSIVTLYKPQPDPALKEVLTKSVGVLAIVDKWREIYFIDNVKFHLDTVQDLGTFVEIEAIDKDPSLGRERLLEQCTEYMRLFKIEERDLLSVSYSDMIMDDRVVKFDGFEH